MEILILLMPFFIEWLEKCQENRSRRDIEAGLMKPGRMEKLAIWFVFRKRTKLRGKKLRAKVREAMEGLRDMEPEYITEMMEDIPVREEE